MRSRIGLMLGDDPELHRRASATASKFNEGGGDAILFLKDPMKFLIHDNVPRFCLADAYGYSGPLVSTCPYTLRTSLTLPGVGGRIYYQWGHLIDEAAFDEWYQLYRMMPVVVRSHKRRRDVENGWGIKPAGVCYLPEPQFLFDVLNYKE